MFDHDRSAARGEMATRKLILFRHESALGNAQAQSLFDRVKTWRVFEGERHPAGASATHNWPPARHWSDYAVTIDQDDLPSGVEIIER
jgi:CRISPR-associated protein Csd2